MEKQEIKKPFEYEIKQVTGPDGTVSFAASTPYRSIIWTGATEEEAVGWMLAGMVQLGRQGYIHPDYPESKGMASAPVQHALTVLTERLQFEIDSRRQNLDMGRRNIGVHEISDWEAVASECRGFPDLNSSIAGIATSIAALARTKTL